MSGGKNVPHQVLDRLAKFEAIWTGKHNDLVKRFNDMVEKHNDLAAKAAAQEEVMKQVAAFTASEMGKFQGTIAQHVAALGRGQQGMDLNILAMAEIVKEVIGQLTQVDVLFRKAGIVGELTEAEVAQVKTDAESWYKDLLGSAFKTARENIEKQEAEQIAREKAEREAAEKAAAEAEAATTEKTSVEAELKKAADDERTIVANTSGGPGAAFPEGADIFGG